jgi:hypothetical protein
MIDARQAKALLLMAFVLSRTLTGCSDRKEGVAKQLLGKWQCTAQTVLYRDGRDQRLDPAMQVEFFPDGTYQAQQGQASSRGTYTVVDAHHYTYQVTQSEHAERVGLLGTTEFSVSGDQLEVLVPVQGAGADAIKRIETTCQRQ